MTLTEENAQIKKTFLGVDAHGIFTFTLCLDYGGAGQWTPGYCLRNGVGSEAPNAIGLLWEVLNIVGVESWEELEGKYVRALFDGRLIAGLRNITGDARVVFDEYLNAP